MANMSYCRFENTKIDLEDCVFALEDILNGDADELSEREKRASDRMYELCQEYIEKYEMLND